MKSLRPILWLYTLPAILLALIPAVPAALLYDRTAILHGQLWRLWTGHWIHFSWSHLGWNLVVLLLAGAELERLRPDWLLRYTLLAAPVMSGLLLVLAPTMTTYGGLSGLAAGVVTLLGIAHLRLAGIGRIFGWSLLTLLAAKVAYDLGTAQPLLAHFNSATVRPSATGHIAGAALAVLFSLRAKVRAHRVAPVTSTLA